MCNIWANKLALEIRPKCKKIAQSGHTDRYDKQLKVE